jgi:hypothetical protein
MTRRRKHNIIVLCALRYALYRHSYVPSLVAEYIIDVWKTLDNPTRFNITKELTEHIEEVRDTWRNDTLCSTDLATWENLLTTIKTLEANERKGSN